MDETKALVDVRVKVDDAKPGHVVLEFAAFGEVDRQGEITKRGAFGTQKVLLGAFGHSSFGMMGNPAPPIGTGTITEKGDVAIADVQFNLDMEAGRETFESVKMSGDLQEWSYGFRVTKESTTMVDGKPVRVLDKLAVKEVSPVIIGAGNRTRTVSIKAFGNLTLEDHSDEALDTVSGYLDRLKSLADLRAKEGRVLSGANRTRLTVLRASLDDISTEIDTLLAADDKPDPDDAGKAAALLVKAAYLKSEAQRRGEL